ncbi:kinase-like domain-containing protein [Gigaspora rosea]|uniref:Kinase-like domain-containing protein n=1 Tax=Gigaspora rosea TaxID=44941 RepID=A0A397UAG4_9GLOM|nr:kinase-like domain-containing protein [Gigaspora rosea]
MMLKRGDIQVHDYSGFGNFNEVGKGSHSVVYSAEYYGEKIACKKFTRPEDKVLVNELKQHITVNNHENIIKFLGITASSEIPGNDYMIVLQFANGGNLTDYLRSKIHDSIFKISWAELIQIAEQIILGIQHLHSNKIVHRNLHPKNILINDNKVLISGFGSAWKFDDSLISLFDEGITYEYIDPQIFIKSRYMPNIKSDIYSLGVLLWELTSGIHPFSKIPNKRVLTNLISKGKRERRVPGTPSNYVKLYKKCWNTKPKKRPELEEILRKLQQSREAANIIKNHIS